MDLTHLAHKIPPGIPLTVSTNAVFADDMRAWAKGLSGHTIEIIIEDADHADRKLGALGATAKWIQENSIKEDILLLAGDNYVGFDVSRLTRAFRNNPLIAAYDIQQKELAKPFGTIIVSDVTDGTGLRKIEHFEEKPEHPKSSFVSTGCCVLPSSTLPIVLEYAKAHPDNIGGIFEEFLRRGTQVDCMVFTEPWKDIGSFRSYMDIHKQLLGDRHMLDQSASVDKETILQDGIALGPEVKVMKSTLKNCILFGKSRIEDCVLEECIIDEDCDLRGIDLTGKMLRAGTVLRRD